MSINQLELLCLVLYVNFENVPYFDSFGDEQLPKEI